MPVGSGWYGGIDPVQLVRSNRPSGAGRHRRQWTLGQIVTALTGAGLRFRHLGDEPFWRMGGVTAAAWDGRLPNTFSLLATRPA